jgi:CubicO group peptidase (beta-lactamase class C family)
VTIRQEAVRPTRRQVLAMAGTCVAGLGCRGWRDAAPGTVATSPPARYFPPPEPEGGWRVTAAGDLGVDVARLGDAVRYHDESPVTTSHGGALAIVYQGHLISESYVTGTDGGPARWDARTCNDMKSSTKSVFGTAAGVFLEEFRDRVTLEPPLVGASAAGSLVPQIWEQPLTDERKARILVKHTLSMTSGHESREPWLAPARRRHVPGHAGPFQMYEYCFGWWEFEGIPAHHTLRFEPGTDYTYSNFGMEQFALAMRNISGEELGPYVYDRVLGPIGMDRRLANSPAWPTSG